MEETEDLDSVHSFASSQQSSQVEPSPLVAPLSPAAVLESNHSVVSDDASFVDEQRIPVLNPIILGTLFKPELRQCNGYLYKKGGSKGGYFNRRNWNRRLFVINTDIGDNHNFTLKYFKDKDPAPKGELTLEGTRVEITEGAHSNANVGFEFRIVGSRDTDFEVYAEKEEERTLWLAVLNHAIQISNARGQFLRNRGIKVVKGDNSNRVAERLSEDYDTLRDPRKSSRFLASTKKKNKSAALKKASDDGVEERKEQSAFSMGGNSNQSSASKPTFALRLDLDLDTLPPGSSQRKEFMDSFQEDIGRVCELNPEHVRICGLRSDSKMDWMTMVEFELAEESGMTSSSVLGIISQRLHASVMDSHSVLYSGFTTCHVDPTFFRAPSEEGVDKQTTVRDLFSETYSPDDKVRAIAHKYGALPVVERPMEAACFCIHLVWDGLVRDLWVLNPRLFDRNACLIYGHDIKRALGILGTLNDLWMEVTHLSPLGLRDGMSSSVELLPSIHSHGIPVVDAVLLKAGLRYSVVFNDLRQEAIAKLSEEEKGMIVDAFHEFDTNHDGSISRDEALHYAKTRTAERRRQIEEQYENYTKDDTLTHSQIMAAHATKNTHLQRLAEAEKELLLMLEKADVNGDSIVSFPEFVLAEAWWLKSSMNPSRISLF